MWINGTQPDRRDYKSKDAFFKILEQNTSFYYSKATQKVHQIHLS